MTEIKFSAYCFFFVSFFLTTRLPAARSKFFEPPPTRKKPKVFTVEKEIPPIPRIRGGGIMSGINLCYPPLPPLVAIFSKTKRGECTISSVGDFFFRKYKKRREGITPFHLDYLPFKIRVLEKKNFRHLIFFLVFG